MKYSPSSLQQFADCPRKWAWRKIHGIVFPPSLYQEFGLALHRPLELYLRDGVPLDLTTDAGNAAMAGVHLLPRPGGLLVESAWEYEIKGFVFHGFADVMGYGAPPFPGAFVIDHKTTSDFRWAKTPESLRTDLQGGLYAHAAMLHFGVDRCDLRWVYYRRNKPYRAMPVDVHVTRECIEPVLARAVDLASRMALATDALSLTPNVEHCGAYGGCPYRANCTDLTPERVMVSLMANNDPTSAAFFAHLEAQKAPTLSPDGKHMLVNGAWVPVPPVPINPPPAPPPEASAPEAPKRRGRPPKSANAPSGGWDAVADALEALAEAVRGL